MCLGVCGVIEELSGNFGFVNILGVSMKVSMVLIDHPRIGDTVLIHSGFAIQKVNPNDQPFFEGVYEEILGENQNE